MKSLQNPKIQKSKNPKFPGRLSGELWIFGFLDWKSTFKRTNICKDIVKLDKSTKKCQKVQKVQKVQKSAKSEKKKKKHKRIQKAQKCTKKSTTEAQKHKEVDRESMAGCSVSRTLYMSMWVHWGGGGGGRPYIYICRCIIFSATLYAKCHSKLKIHPSVCVCTHIYIYVYMYMYM